MEMMPTGVDGGHSGSIQRTDHGARSFSLVFASSLLVRSFFTLNCLPFSFWYLLASRFCMGLNQLLVALIARLACCLCWCLFWKNALRSVISFFSPPRLDCSSISYWCDTWSICRSSPLGAKETVEGKGFSLSVRGLRLNRALATDVQVRLGMADDQTEGFCLMIWKEAGLFWWAGVDAVLCWKRCARWRMSWWVSLMGYKGEEGCEGMYLRWQRALISGSNCCIILSVLQSQQTPVIPPFQNPFPPCIILARHVLERENIGHLVYCLPLRHSPSYTTLPFGLYRTPYPWKLPQLNSPQYFSPEAYMRVPLPCCLNQQVSPMQASPLAWVILALPISIPSTHSPSNFFSLGKTSSPRPLNSLIFMCLISVIMVSRPPSASSNILPSSRQQLSFFRGERVWEDCFLRDLERAADDFSLREVLMTGTEGQGGGGRVLETLKREALIGCLGGEQGMDSSLLTVRAVRPNRCIMQLSRPSSSSAPQSSLSLLSSSIFVQLLIEDIHLRLLHQTG